MYGAASCIVLIAVATSCIIYIINSLLKQLIHNVREQSGNLKEFELIRSQSLNSDTDFSEPVVVNPANAGDFLYEEDIPANLGMDKRPDLLNIVKN
jgi:hypothetical protein